MRGQPAVDRDREAVGAAHRLTVEADRADLDGLLAQLLPGPQHLPGTDGVQLLSPMEEEHLDPERTAHHDLCGLDHHRTSRRANNTRACERTLTGRPTACVATSSRGVLNLLHPVLAPGGDGVQDGREPFPERGQLVADLYGSGHDDGPLHDPGRL